MIRNFIEKGFRTPPSVEPKKQIIEWTISSKQNGKREFKPTVSKWISIYETFTTNTADPSHITISTVGDKTYIHVPLVGLVEYIEIKNCPCEFYLATKSSSTENNITRASLDSSDGKLFTNKTTCSLLSSLVENSLADTPNEIVEYQDNGKGFHFISMPYFLVLDRRVDNETKQSVRIKSWNVYEWSTITGQGKWKF